MKYLKTYEDAIKYSDELGNIDTSQPNPKEGDYVIIDGSNFGDIGKNFYQSIGKIIRKEDMGSNYSVEFNFIRPWDKPDDNKKTFLVYDHEILYHSENKEELEKILIENKYNI